jgi:PAS domain S-box-containing protein
MSPPGRQRYASEIERDRLFRALIHNTFNVIAVLDESMRFLYVSPSVERVLGYTPEELIGRSPFEFMRPDENERLREREERILRDRAFNERVEAEVRHKDGSWRTMEFAIQNRLDDPDVGGVVVNYRDVTDRTRWQRALVESEHRYQKAFMSSPDGIAISRLSDGVFLDVNPSFERTTGHSRDELIGTSTLELNHWKYPEDRERLTAEIRATGRVRGFQSEFFKSDGSTHYGQLSAEVFPYNNEMCMLTCIRDITDQMAAHRELEQISLQLQKDHALLVEKNAALRDLLEHVQDQKNEFRHSLTAAISDLLQPIIDRLRSNGGRLSGDDLDRMEHRLEMIRRRHVQETENNLARLTPRERGICELIREGLSSRQIAQKLGVSPETVNKHRQSIRRKLQIDHRGINLTTYLRST